MGLSSYAIVGVVEHLNQTVNFAWFKVGAVYFDATINQIIESATKLTIYLTCPNNTGVDMTVTEIKIFNSHGELWYTGAINITSAVDVSVKIEADVTVS